MNKIIVRGTQNFMGMEIPIIAGGFGEGCKAMLAKTIAEIHNQPLKKINQLINENLDEFEFGIDILDLRLVLSKYQSLENVLLSSGYTKRGLTATLNQNGNIYLLSEQGYMLLVGFMRTEKAKEIRKQLRREYFAMREVINSAESSSLELYNEGLRKHQQMLDEDREILDQWKKATATPKRVTNIYVNAIKRELGVDSAKHKDYINVKEMILEYFEVGTLEALPKNNIEVLNKIVQTCRNYNPGYSQISMFDED